MSHPSWVRGLKFDDDDVTIPECRVAPFMGAWIEMAGCAGGCHYAWVAPFMGAWIEMIRSSMKTGTGKRSHPSRVRGLKSVAIDQISYPGNGRTLHGCVD